MEQDPAPADLCCQGRVNQWWWWWRRSGGLRGGYRFPGDLLIREKSPGFFPRRGEEPPLKEKVRPGGGGGPGSV